MNKTTQMNLSRQSRVSQSAILWQRFCSTASVGNSVDERLVSWKMADAEGSSSSLPKK